MVGMISCVVLIFLWGQTGATTRKPRCSFFPELDPINFPYVACCVDFSAACNAGAANIGIVGDVTSPILLFPEFFYISRQNL